MDVSSLNSGTVTNKEWLNPVVGSLLARSVGASSFQVIDEASDDTVQLSGGIYRRAAGSSPTFTVPAVTPPFGAGMVEVGTSQANEGDVPISALAAGCSFELYMSGRFIDQSPAAGGTIVFYPCFQATQPTDYPQALCELPVDGGAVSILQGFETRMIFRIISTTDTSFQFECSWTTMMNLAAAAPSQVRQNTNTVTGSLTTPSRAASVTKRFPFTIWARGESGPFTLTRTQLYLRRIS